MSISFRLWNIALSCGFVAGAYGFIGAAHATEFKLAHVYETTHPMHVAAVEAANKFKACSQGRHSISVFPASTLGSEKAINEQIRFGSIDIIFNGQIFASSAYKPLAIGAAPFIFKDRAQALRYRTSPIFKDLWEGWNKATGQTIQSAG